MARANYSNCHVLQHPDLSSGLQPQQFEIDFWRENENFQEFKGGRGPAVRISLEGRDAILRHYYRGGVMGRFLTDQYFWIGKRLSRPWREWSVLEFARNAGLPVPEPIAVCVCRVGLYYSGAIITHFLPNTETLADFLAKGSVNKQDWYRLGELIKRLQALGIFHTDLTVNNILLDSDKQIFLIDFDNARIITKIGDWQWRPLARLQRSVQKFWRQQGGDYSEEDWQALMDGYQS